jgi:hypothetical protein
MDNEIAVPPGQCRATRKPRFFEMLRYWILGKHTGFDPVYETRCFHYDGHEQYANHSPDLATHKDITGFKWKTDAPRR